MTALPIEGDGSIDWTLVSHVNGLARDLPSGVDSLLGLLGEYGVPLLSVLMLLATWLWARRRPDAPVAVAGVLWAGLASGVSLMLNVPVRAMVKRERPFVAHPGQLDLLRSHQANGSFASDHATFTMAVAVGIMLVNRKYGLVAMALAGVEGFLREQYTRVGAYVLATSFGDRAAWKEMTYSAHIPHLHDRDSNAARNFIAVFEEMMELLHSAVPAVSAA